MAPQLAASTITRWPAASTPRGRDEPSGANREDDTAIALYAISLREHDTGNQQQERSQNALRLAMGISDVVT